MKRRVAPRDVATPQHGPSRNTLQYLQGGDHSTRLHLQVHTSHLVNITSSQKIMHGQTHQRGGFQRQLLPSNTRCNSLRIIYRVEYTVKKACALSVVFADM